MGKNDKDLSVAKSARALVRRCRHGTLATVEAGRRKGWPYASLVTVAFAMDGSPILLLSTLADHTRNLLAEPRASLLFEEAGHLPNPQTGERVTLSGRISRTADKGLARRFLARHPDAELYAGFGDFGFFRLKVDRAHYVGGFGRAHRISAKNFQPEGEKIQALTAAESSLIEQLNREQPDILAAWAGKGWKAITVDPDGMDFRRGKAFKRIEFSKTVGSGRTIRAEIRKNQKK